MNNQTPSRTLAIFFCFFIAACGGAADKHIATATSGIIADGTYKLTWSFTGTTCDDWASGWRRIFAQNGAFSASVGGFSGAAKADGTIEFERETKDRFGTALLEFKGRADSKTEAHGTVEVTSNAGLRCPGEWQMKPW